MKFEIEMNVFTRLHPNYCVKIVFHNVVHTNTNTITVFSSMVDVKISKTLRILDHFLQKKSRDSSNLKKASIIFG